MDKLYEFFSIQRRIFGLCRTSGQLFRLSDCKVYLKTTPSKDWTDIISDEDDGLCRFVERLGEREESLREKARVKGRKMAQKMIRAVDERGYPLAHPAQNSASLTETKGGQLCIAKLSG
jgi:hypothetical protein